MSSSRFTGIFLSAGIKIQGKENIDAYSKYLVNLIEKHGSSNKNLLITNQPEELNVESVKDLNIIPIATKTKGALTSLAFSLDHIENENPVIIFPTNSNVYFDIEKFLSKMQLEKNNAGIVCFESNDTNYSYIRVKEGEIIEFKEKEVIGNLATAGIFYFKNKHEIIKCLEWCLLNNINTDGIYYLAPSLNYFVCNNMNIGLEIIPSKNYSRLELLQDAQIGNR